MVNRNTIETAADMDTILQKLLAHNPAMQIFLAQIIPIRGDQTRNDSTEILNQHFALLASNYSNVHLVDMYTNFEVNSYYKPSDDVHVSQEGADTMAYRWYNVLSSVVPPPPLNINEGPHSEDDHAPFASPIEPEHPYAYPVPTHGKSISLHLPQKFKLRGVELYDLQGRLLKSIQAGSQSQLNSIDLSGLTPGLYHIHFVGKRRVVQKINLL